MTDSPLPPWPPTAVDWQVTTHGKQIDPATNAPPLRAGYMSLGRSAAFPPELINECLPAKVEIRDDGTWWNTDWTKGGGPAQFTLRPVCAAGRWYLQAARLFGVRGHAAGETRDSHATVFAVAPVDQVEDRTLAGLLDALRHPPGRSTDEVRSFQLPPRSDPLPADWFDKDIRTMLAAVIAGRPAAVQAPNLSPDDFVRKALLCLACLPAGVRWRVPIGGGFFMTPPEYGFAHGVKASAKADIRRIGGDWKLDADLSAGVEVVREIEPQLAAARSTDAVYAAAANYWGPELSRRSPRGVADATPWTEAVGLLRESGGIARLKAYLAGGGGVRPKINDFFSMKPLFLATVLAAAGGRRADAPVELVLQHGVTDFNPQVSPAVRAAPVESPAEQLLNDLCRDDLRDVWAAVANGSSDEAPRAGTLAQLLGYLPPSIPQAIRPEDVWLVPAAKVGNTAVQTLTTAWQQTTGGWERWAPLIGAAGQTGAPAVLRDWLHRIGTDVAWRGLELELGDPQVRCVSTWSRAETEKKGVRAAFDIHHGTLPVPADFDVLLTEISAPRADTAGRLAGRAFELWYVPEALLLAHTANQYGAKTAGNAVLGRFAPERLTTEDPGTRTRWGRLALDGLTVRYGPRTVLLRTVFDLYNDLPSDTDRNRFADRFDPTTRYILFDTTAAFPARAEFGPAAYPHEDGTRKLAEEKLPELLERAPGCRERAIRVLTRSAEFPDRERIMPLLSGLVFSPNSPLSGPVFQLARDLVGRVGRHHAGQGRLILPPLSVADALLALDLLGPDFAGEQTIDPLDVTADQARAVAVAAGSNIRNIWNKNGMDDLLPVLLADQTDPDDTRFWRRVFKPWKLDQEPGPRLLTGDPLDCPSPSEERTLLKLSDQLFESTVARCGKIPGTVLGRLVMLLGMGHQFQLEFLRLTVRAATGNTSLAEALARYLIGRMSRSERDRCREAWKESEKWSNWRRSPSCSAALAQLLLDLMYNWHGDKKFVTQCVEWLRMSAEWPPAMATLSFRDPPRL